jgi:sulfoacetaldehyde acetyltransferase
MTNSEALVETMVAQGVTDTFGIVGSAFMDPLDMFEAAGIRFVSVAHEQNAAHMADGYARVSGKHGVCISQNGPGITNFVTGVAAAFWAHSPVIAITPEAGTLTKGHGGFQEVDQLPIFETITKYQAHVNNAARMSELTGRAFDIAMMERGPVQLNIPRDFFYGDNKFNNKAPNPVEKSAGGPTALEEAAQLLASAKNPIILAGGGVVMGDAVPATTALAEHLGVPVVSTYLHNDSFPSDHPLAAGPLGYCGSQAAMKAMGDADVILALGTRLGPFGTLPQYGMDYWPQNAKIIQVEVDQRRLGLVKPVDVALHGDAKLAAEALLEKLQGRKVASAGDKQQRLDTLNGYKAEWEAYLADLATANEDKCPPGRMVPRQVLKELEKAMPGDAMVSTDIGNTCSVSNSYLKFSQPNSMLAAMAFGNCGYAFPAAMGAKVARPDRPAVAYVGDGAWGMSLNEVMTCVRESIPTTAIVFNNGQWGAEKKNQVLWFGDRYAGTNLKTVKR